jgi:hypothetical protein
LELALVIDDRTDHLADKEQAADGWREWLRISNAVNLREQPTVITTVTTAIAEGGTEHAKPGTVTDSGGAWPAGWAEPYHQAMAGRERSFLEELMRLVLLAGPGHVAVPVVGYEEDSGMPIDFAWPGKRVAVCLNLDAEEQRDLEAAGWRVFPGDPDAVFAALREAA